MLPATTPAQEFGEWTCLDDERSTTCDNGGVAPRHHARRECALTEEYASLRLSPRSLTRDVNLLLFATTTGSRHVFTRVRLDTHPCSRTRRMDGLDVRDVWDGLDGAKATGVGRVRPFAIFSSLFYLQIGARDSCGTLRSTRAHPCSRIRTVDHFSLTQQHRQAEEYASLRHPFALFAGTAQPAALRDDEDFYDMSSRTHASLLKNLTRATLATSSSLCSARPRQVQALDDDAEHGGHQ